MWTKVWNGLILGTALAAGIGCGAGADKSPSSFQSSAAALTATGNLVFFRGTNAPGGGLFLGGSLWADDTGLCNYPGPFPTRAATSCVYGSFAGDRISLKVPGQLAPSLAQGFVYVPDSSSHSAGLWRFKYDAVNQTITSTADVLVPSAGLGGQRPQALALGPDGSLYAGFASSGNIVKVTNPSGVLGSQVSSTVGGSSFGHRVFGLVFVGNDLYLAETNGLTVIKNATACASGCKATLVGGTAAVETVGVAVDVAGAVYISQGTAVYRYTPSTGSLVTYANAGTLPVGFTDATDNCTAGLCGFAFQAGTPNALFFDVQGNLNIAEDPTPSIPGNTPNSVGRIWQILAGTPAVGP